MVADGSRATAWVASAAPARRREGGQHQLGPGAHDAPFVAVLDCDHVPVPAFLERPSPGPTTRPWRWCRPPSTTRTGTAAGRRGSWAAAVALLRHDRARSRCARRDVLLWHQCGASGVPVSTPSALLDRRRSPRTSSYRSRLHERDGARIPPGRPCAGTRPRRRGSYVSQQLRGLVDACRRSRPCCARRCRCA